MAEARNSFIKSKMNRDLDARLVPPGEYRDAQNVSVSKSEGADVGSLENVLGNISLTDFGLTAANIDVVGFFMDLNNNRIFVFMSNYVDTSSDRLSNFAPSAAQCHIGVYNISNSTASLLVSGSFLNFSKTSPVLSVNLINSNLYFTDNRNQPRKINVDRALGSSTYYTTEDQISLSKYYPYEPISLIAALVTNVNSGFAGSGYTPDINLQTTGGSGTGLTVDIAANGSLTLRNPGFGYVNGETIIPILRTGGGTGAGPYTIVVQEITTMQDVTSPRLPDGFINPYYNANWPGDKNYLKDKFVRFAYRFKFDDGEYSLISPFTQACFIPQQDGYFIDDDKDKTFKSTEVDFMQNKVNNIKLLIPSPAESSNWSDATTDLKISEVEVIFKDDSQTTLKLIETIPASDFSTSTSPLLIYEYQSRKPFRTLPTRDLLRVYDQVPVRALAQEVVGNRLVFGNIVDKHTPPNLLNFNTQSGFKVEESAATGTESSLVRREYQNHTLKQNRTYQVGVVLSDKYGRQSDTILSTVDDNSQNTILKGSTIYHPYKDGEKLGGTAQSTANTFSYYTSPTDPALPLTNNLFSGAGDTWPGDQLRIRFNELISSTFNSSLGTPGLYSTTNPLGWYSYKIVVKQTEVDYYNVYCPGVLNGYIDGETPSPLNASLQEPVGHFVLHSDNLSKIPKDTSLVGPNQNVFRTARPSFSEDPDYYQFTDTNGNLFQVDPYSEEGEQLLKTRDRERDLDSGSQVNNASVELFTRVLNAGEVTTTFSTQYYPEQKSEIVTAIGTGSDLGLFAIGNVAKYPYNAAPVFYNYEQNPFIAKINIYSANTATTIQPNNFGLTGPSKDASEYIVKCDGVGATGGSGGTNYPGAGGSGVPVVFEGTGTDDVKFRNKGIQITFKINSAAPGVVSQVIITNEGSGWDTADIPMGGSISALATIAAAGDANCKFGITVTRKALGTQGGTSNNPLAMRPMFSVFETNPLDSKLDIYWETSTSGKISELNTNIALNDNYTPYGFRSQTNIGTTPVAIAWAFPENVPLNNNLFDGYVTDYLGDPISNTLDPTTYPINPTFTLISATDSASTPNDVTSDFNILSLGGGRFAIRNSVYKYFGSNSSTNDIYNFTIRVTTPSSTYLSDGTLLTSDLGLIVAPGTSGVNPTLALTNRIPTIAIQSYGATTSGTRAGCGSSVDVADTVSGDQEVYEFQVFNGTNLLNTSGRGEDLSVQAVIADEVVNTYFSVDYTSGSGATTGKLNVLANAYNNIGAGPFTFNVTVTDGGGLQASCLQEIRLLS
jgi:hypothetical protein